MSAGCRRSIGCAFCKDFRLPCQPQTERGVLPPHPRPAAQAAPHSPTPPQRTRHEPHRNPRQQHPHRPQRLSENQPRPNPTAQRQHPHPHRRASPRGSLRARHHARQPRGTRAPMAIRHQPSHARNPRRQARRGRRPRRVRLARTGRRNPLHRRARGKNPRLFQRPRLLRRSAAPLPRPQHHPHQQPATR